jgi:hypothetical protein
VRPDGPGYRNPTTPSDPDAAPLARCCEFFAITDLLRAWDAEEIELTTESAMAAYWDTLDIIAATPATTDRGRRAKLQAA